MKVYTSSLLSPFCYLCLFSTFIWPCKLIFPPFLRFWCRTNWDYWQFAIPKSLHFLDYFVNSRFCERLSLRETSYIDLQPLHAYTRHVPLWGNEHYIYFAYVNIPLSQIIITATSSQRGRLEMTAFRYGHYEGSSTVVNWDRVYISWLPRVKLSHSVY